MRIKEGKFSVYEIDPMYLEYLSKYDKNVRKKSNRKYYGILITKEKTDYCIPFTSKVKKRNPKLTINIKNKKEVIAQLTINNMIPVIDDVVHKVNIKNDKSKYYLYRELYFLRKYDVIQEILLFSFIKNIIYQEKLYFIRQRRFYLYEKIFWNRWY